MKFDESQTKGNLQIALQGEALAHLKYQWYKKKLTEFNQGYENILNEIIHNEKEHGEIWFKLLHENKVPSNIENLTDAIQGETYEATEMYKNFGKVAREEGFHDIADLFYQIALIEQTHADRFVEIRNEITKSDYYKADNIVTWKCLNCGHQQYSDKAPKECPVCKHPIKYFIKEE